jgi:hypothetical protein
VYFGRDRAYSGGSRAASATQRDNMKGGIMKRVLFAAAAATALAAAVLAPGGASAQGGPEGTNLLHGIPGVPVDVYVDGTVTFAGFQPGASEDLSSFAGSALNNVEIFAEGADPTADTPLLTAASLSIPSSGHNSVVFHNDASGTPKISAYVNNATQTGEGVGRITIRHAAAAGPVDLVLTNGDRPLLNLTNGGSQEFGPAVGSYDVQLAEAGSGLIPGTATTVQATEGQNLIVYAVGSAADGISYITASIDVGVLAGATTTTDPNATTTTTTTDPNATTTTSTSTTTTTSTSTTTTTLAPVPVAVNTGSPLGGPVSLTLIVIALGALVATGGALVARRRV